MTTAKLFKNGRSQAVRLPKEFRLHGNAVYITHLGSSVLLTPVSNGWEPLFEACKAFSSDFMLKRPAQPRLQSRKYPWR